MAQSKTKFSIPEIRRAGLTFDVIKKNNISVDTRRKSCKSENVKELKSKDLPKKYNYKNLSSKKPEEEKKEKLKQKHKSDPIKELKPIKTSPKPSLTKVEANRSEFGLDPKVESAVKTMFEKKPLYGKKAELMDAIEKYLVPIAEMSKNQLFETLKDKDVIEYSRSKPRGYSLT